eukprot:6419715-Pyramimonas_sp.AAC.1
MPEAQQRPGVSAASCAPLRAHYTMRTRVAIGALRRLAPREARGRMGPRDTSRRLRPNDAP